MRASDPGLEPTHHPIPAAGRPLPKKNRDGPGRAGPEGGLPAVYAFGNPPTSTSTAAWTPRSEASWRGRSKSSGARAAPSVAVSPFCLPQTNQVRPSRPTIPHRPTLGTCPASSKPGALRRRAVWVCWRAKESALAGRSCTARNRRKVRASASITKRASTCLGHLRGARRLLQAITARRCARAAKAELADGLRRGFHRLCYDHVTPTSPIPAVSRCGERGHGTIPARLAADVLTVAPTSRRARRGAQGLAGSRRAARLPLGMRSSGPSARRGGVLPASAPPTRLAPTGNRACCRRIRPPRAPRSSNVTEG